MVANRTHNYDIMTWLEEEERKKKERIKTTMLSMKRIFQQEKENSQVKCRVPLEMRRMVASYL